MFDFNEPILTPAIFNTLDVDAPSSSVEVLPNFSIEQFYVSWAGDDGTGSGVASYDIYVSDNGGPFVLWRNDTTRTKALFQGEDQHTYAFFSVATDHVGHSEPMKDAAEAGTTTDATLMPVVEDVLLAVNGTTQINVVFSHPLALADQIADGSIVEAFAVLDLQADYLPTDASQFAYDEGTQTLSWSAASILPDGVYELQLDGSQFATADGLQLRGGSSTSVRFALPDFGPAEPLEADSTVIAVDAYSVPSLADFNGDGLLDLLVGEKTAGGEGKVRVYLNGGTAAEPVFSDFSYVQADGAELAVPASGCLGAFPRMVDWNGDGIDDLLVGLSDGTIQWFENTGTATAPLFAAGLAVNVGDILPGTLDVGDRATFDVVDWNEDGRLDLVTGNLAGELHVFLNSADFETPILPAPVAVLDSANEPLTVPGGRASVAVVDLDGDGRKDIVVGNTDGRILFARNVGTDAAPKFDNWDVVYSDGQPIDLPGTPRSRPFVGDYNSDGTLDLLVGAADGQVRLYTGQPTDEIIESTLGLPGELYTFTFEVPFNTAPTADPGGPYTVPECGTVTLDATASTDPNQDDAALTFAWDLDGDGQYDDATGPQAEFSADGLDGPATTTVGLLVVDDDGASNTATVQITVTNAAPSASIGGPYTVAEGGTVGLDASSSSDPAADGLSFAWDFNGDGQYDDATGAQPDFSAAGLDGPSTVTVGLQVTDDDGATDTATLDITVTNAAPTADTGGPYTVAEGEIVGLDASASTDPGSDTLTFAWDFDGDGQYDDATGAHPDFSAVGLDGPSAVTVGLQVTDDDGDSDTATFDIAVANVAPTADAGGPYTVAEGGIVGLDASASSDPGPDALTFAWDFDGDGQYDDATGAQPDFSAADLDGPSTVTVGLQVTDDDGATDTATAEITVTAPAVTAHIGGPYTVDEGGATPLDATASTGDTLTYAWDFDGDGQYDDATGAQPDFSAVGLDGPTSVTIGLQVTDADGNSDTATAVVTVENADPALVISGMPTSPFVGQPINLLASVSDPGQADTHDIFWSCILKTLDYDMGELELEYATGTGATISLVPALAGEYTITTTATDDDGGTTEDVVTLIVGNDLGTVDYRLLSHMSLVEGNYSFTLLPMHSGTLTLEVLAPQPPKSARLDLYERDEMSNSSFRDLASSQLVGENQRIDWEVTQGHKYYVSVYGANPDFDIRVVNLLHHGGTTATVYGTDGDDLLVFSAANSRSITINGADYAFEDSELTTLEFDGGNGLRRNPPLRLRGQRDD